MTDTIGDIRTIKRKKVIAKLTNHIVRCGLPV